MRRTARSCPTIRAPRRSSKSRARGLFCSGSSRTVSSICFSGACISSTSISAIMAVVPCRSDSGLSGYSLLRDPPNIPLAKNDPLRQLMRGKVSAFAFRKPALNRGHHSHLRYIYDSEKNVTQNIRAESTGVVTAELRQNYIRDISRQKTGDISCWCLRLIMSYGGRNTPKGIRHGGKGLEFRITRQLGGVSRNTPARDA